MLFLMGLTGRCIEA
ncbi:hypothetical protein OIU78_021854, partial [Salix suchowensis]